MKKMTLWGIGPTLALVTLTYATATAVLSQGRAELAIDIVPRNGLVATGIALIAVGGLMYLASAKTIISAFGAGQLVTKGAYRLCRHPLYASWILFVFPGIELLLGSWLGLTTPLVMYLVFRCLIAKEEQYLRVKFGDPYLDYQKRVPLILPLGWLRGDR